jgi:hypothetical protein
MTGYTYEKISNSCVRQLPHTPKLTQNEPETKLYELKLYNRKKIGRKMCDLQLGESFLKTLKA